MKNKKGFTLVELVIVIAVIAILAGVMIGTFASVVKKANESRKAQEMAAAKTEQTANDVIEKLSNSNWLGWEDFETNLVAKMTEVYKNAKKDEITDVNTIQEAVKAAVAEYYAKNSQSNTGLTEEQVKYIVETAVAKNAYVGVTAEQVKAIVNSAVSGSSTLTKAQVQAIVDAAQAKNLTAAQVSKAIADATANLATTDDVSEKADEILKKVNEASAKALTEKQVQDIVNAAVWNAGGVTKTWFDETTYATTGKFTVSNAQEVAGLATLVNGGYNFENKNIEITYKKAGADDKAEIDLSEAGNWTPIGNTWGNEFKGIITGAVKNKDGSAAAGETLVIKGLTLNEQFNAVKNGYLINCSSTGNMDKVGVGFVAYLGEGATLSNIVFENVNVNITDDAMDGISIGVAVGYLDGGKIENVTVKGGSVKGVYRVAGLCGAAAWGTIKNCEVADITIESTGTQKGDSTYHAASGIVGYCRNFAIKKDHMTTENAYRFNIKTEGYIKCTNVTTKSAVNITNVFGDFASNGYLVKVNGNAMGTYDATAKKWISANQTSLLTK